MSTVEYFLIIETEIHTIIRLYEDEPEVAIEIEPLDVTSFSIPVVQLYVDNTL